jgi:fluoroquinolone resistance protein
MEKVFITDKVIEKVDFTQTPLELGEYEQCKFIHCNFSSISLAAFNFSDCEFINCNLSLANITKHLLETLSLKIANY